MFSPLYRVSENGTMLPNKPHLHTIFFPFQWWMALSKSRNYLQVITREHHDTFWVLNFSICSRGVMQSVSLNPLPHWAFNNTSYKQPVSLKMFGSSDPAKHKRRGATRRAWSTFCPGDTGGQDLRAANAVYVQRKDGLSGGKRATTISPFPLLQLRWAPDSSEA